MIKLFCDIVLVVYRFLVLITGMVVIFMSLALAYDLKEYYPLAQGNSWTYSVIEDEESYKETVRIEGKEIIGGIETVKMMSAEDNYECIAIDTEGVKKYKDFDEDEYEIYNLPKLILPNNIEIGKIKEYSTASIEYGIDGERQEESTEAGQIQLSAVENVEVSAGKFSSCLKFSLISNKKESDGDYESSDCTIWLAPSVGKVKEVCISTEYEAETKEEETCIEIVELVSAVVDGKRIGRQ